MIIKLPTKLTDKNLDEFISKVFSNYKTKPSDKYYFDLTEVEFIGNQELLVFSGLIKTFIANNIEFEIEFFKKGVSTLHISERVKRQIIQFWDVWRIWQIVPPDSYNRYFGIDGKSVQSLKVELNYYPKLSEIYTRHGVTPFISLNYINNYNEIQVQTIIDPIYKLNSVVEELLKVNNCFHPFTSASLSTIVTEELYLNFLDHSSTSSFNSADRFAFMSISFQSKLDQAKYTSEEIEKIKGMNFESESLAETKDFHFDHKSKKYKNTPYIQFSFLDFGAGIASTLKDQYFSKTKNESSENIDSEILKFAFEHDSSRFPLLDNKSNIDRFIPRGLFDAITIVKRYSGMLIARSNYGKIIFDFSSTNDKVKAFKTFGDGRSYFPGTLISLYIPAIQDVRAINVSSIKPELSFSKIKVEHRKYISINLIASRLKSNKSILYSDLLKELRKEICGSLNGTLAIISFKACQWIEPRVLKKTLYFLLSDYEINHRNNVIIINPPQSNIIDEVVAEILDLNEAIKNYKIHPLPIINFDGDKIEVLWLGVFDKEDKRKLDDLLYEQYSIAKSDFRDPSNIIGHLNEFDQYGNLLSNFPNQNELLEFYKKSDVESTSSEVEQFLDVYGCIKKDNNKSLYLCNGNYYQKEYVDLNNLLNDKNKSAIISQLLLERIKDALSISHKCHYIGVTASSHKLLKSFESLGLITSDEYTILENYHTFETELDSESVDSTKKYVLICDVVSTGYLASRLSKKLLEGGANLDLVAVVVSTLDPTFDTTKKFLLEFKSRIIYLSQHQIKKYKRSEIKSELIEKEIIRINPHTNIPITLSISETNFNESVIFTSSVSYKPNLNEISISNRFLDAINQNAISVGFLKFNNVIHPYFFKTDVILEGLSEDLLVEIFKHINNPYLKNEKIQIFYPRKSSVSYLDFDLLKNVLANHLVEEIEIERFGTPEGWRFPHNTDYLSAKIENNICLVLDDGSCSGDSLIQMIDEISFYQVKEIILLCFIGRVNDHKREFFSRMSSIKVKDAKSIPISIYFACHWHIPTYYIDENPNIRESVWLNEVFNLQNTPQSIKRIATSISREIRAKGDTFYKDYKYLPKTKDSNEIPKKDLILVREELGKVIGYRLYKESFHFFDFFIKKYEILIWTDSRYKEIELLCATFVYEPYLYDKIVGVIPDVVEKIEDFVRVLIFSDQKIYDRLTYTWNKKDIVHLFFIVFKDGKLITELTSDNFKLLIKFTQKIDSTINYILYKLLRYFPLDAKNFNEKKYDSQIRSLISELKNSEDIPNKELKKYYNFITSLPSRNDFASQLTHLKENYSKEKEKEFHDEKKSFNHNISELIVTIRAAISDITDSGNIEQGKVAIIKKCWFKIIDFLNPILSFSSSYKEFLLPYTYYELVNQIDSLRQMVGFIEDVIFSSNDSFVDAEKLETIKLYIEKLQLNFELNSTFHQLIEYHQSNLSTFINSLVGELRKIAVVKVIATGKPDERSVINIPQVYLDKLLISELSTNMKKYHKHNDSSYLTVSYGYINQNIFELVITNTLLHSESIVSNGEGIKCIKLLSDSPIFGFNYESKTMTLEFIQTIRLTVN